MKKMKLFLLIVVVLLILILGLFILHHFTYPIKIDPSTASGQLNPEDTQALASKISQLARNHPAVELYSWVHLGHNVYYLMELDGQLGYATLSRGLNGGYRLDSIHHGTGDFREGIIVDRENKYLLMAGKNSEPRIAKITAEMDGIVYEFVIEGEADHYFFCVELDPQPSSNDMDRSTVVFYDSDGNDITNAYELMGGGFLAA